MDQNITKVFCERQLCYFRAELAEHAERYDDMAKEMTTLVENLSSSSTPTARERNLLSVSFKHLIGNKRNSWRVLNSIDSSSYSEETTASYINEVSKELEGTCKTVIKLLDDILIIKEKLAYDKNKKQINNNDTTNIQPTNTPSPTSTSPEFLATTESLVFYIKMKADYYRYLAEVQDGSQRQETVDHAHQAYKEATKVANADMSHGHPIKLGLALNYSVFHYEILRNTDEACHLAKASFDNAVGILNEIPEEEYKDATLIMQLLKDNLSLWNQEDAE